MAKNSCWLQPHYIDKDLQCNVKLQYVYSKFQVKSMQVHPHVMKHVNRIYLSVAIGANCCSKEYSLG